MEASEAAEPSLERLWATFVVENNLELKEEKLRLFFKELDNSVGSWSLLSVAVPSTICSYFLELVCGEITNAASSNQQTPIEELERFHYRERSGSFSKAALETSEDITAIISLRKLFTNGIGYEILKYFLFCDINQIPSRKPLCHILISVFPNSQWNPDVKTVLKTPVNFCDFLQNSIIISSKSSCPESENPPIDLKIIFPDRADSEISSDKIASLLIALIIKLVQNENEIVLNSQCVTIECLEFALEKIFHTSESISAENEEVIDIMFMVLIQNCLNNLIIKNKDRDNKDLKIYLEQLLDCFDRCTTKPSETNIYFKVGLIYLIFGIALNSLNLSKTRNKVYNCFGIYFEKGVQDKFLYDFKIFSEVFESKEEQNTFFKKITEIIFEINSLFVESPSSSLVSVKSSRSKKHVNIKQLHCQHSKVPCTLQKIVINGFQYFSDDLKKSVMKKILAESVCCCLYDEEFLNMMVNGTCYDSELEKMKLKFVANKYMPAVFGKDLRKCGVCRKKQEEKAFRDKVVSIYKTKSKTAHPSTFLKHMQKLANHITYDIASDILFEIIQPFMKTKEKPLVSQTLNVIICFLKDIRIQKDFFNQESINNIESLLYDKEFCRICCDLIRIGIETGSFLGQDVNEQENIYQKLMELQISPGFDIIEIIKGRKSSVNLVDEFHNSSVFWFYNLELFKRIPSFREKFQEKCLQFENAQPPHLILTDVVPTLLRCYFKCNPSKQNHLENIDSISKASPIRMTMTLKKYCVSDGFELSALTTFHAVSQFYYQDLDNDSWFLNNLLETQEFVPIFDVKRRKEIVPIENECPEYYIVDWNCINHSSDKETTFFGKLVNLFSNYLWSSVGGTSSPNNSDKVHEIENLVISDVLERRECKKYLLKIIESCLSILFRFKGESEFDDAAMDVFLDKLKMIVLSTTSESSECSENSNAVLDVLQVLLKISEIAPVKTTKLVKSLKHDRSEVGTLNTSIESDVEYYSSKTSCSHQESEMEISENETEEYYVTGDEGYEADCEIHDQDLSGEDGDLENIRDLWNPYIPSSRYKTKIIHSGVCQIIVEILINLSQKCVKESKVWVAPLNKLVNSLFSIKELLGGSLLLLKGFSPVLSVNRPDLADFQQSILNLITEINTPEILQIYFHILSSKNPPVEVLMKFLVYRIFSDIKKQPKMELIFPIKRYETNCLYPANALDFEKINSIFNNHENYEIMATPFTKCAAILPLRCENLFGNFTQGFSISLWTQVKSTPLKKDVRMNHKMHLISVGNERILLSIYLTKNLCIAFETSKPNAKIRNQLQTEIEEHDLIAKDISPPHDHESTLKTAYKHTKAKLLSFSQRMHSPQKDSDELFHSVLVELKHQKLQVSKWTHLGFSVNVKRDNFEIISVVDGSEQHAIRIPCSSLNSYHNPSFQALLIGDSESVEENFDYSFALSNVFLFGSFLDKNSLRCLTSLGPDCSNLSHCKAGNLKPNFGYLNYNHPCGLLLNNFSENLCKLNHNILAIYSSNRSKDYLRKVCVGDEKTKKCEMVKSPIIHSGDIETNYVKSIQTSVILSGGMRSLLYLFARVVELTNDPITQALSLDLLLNVAFSDSTLYTEFIKSDFLSLIGCVISTDQCSKDINLLKSIVNNACNQPIITRKLGTIKVSENTSACIIYPDLIVNLISRYSDWHNNKATYCGNSEILSILLQCIYALVRDKHPHKNFNIEQLSRYGLIKELLNLCKIHIIQEFKPTFLTPNSAELFVEILGIFASPPTPSIIDEIVKLLLLLHKPNKRFILHDRSQMYFLVSSEQPLKPKSLINIPGTAQFWSTSKKNYVNSIKERKTNKDRLYMVSSSPLKTFKSNRKFSTSYETLAAIVSFDTQKINEKKLQRYFKNGNLTILKNIKKLVGKPQSNRVYKKYRKKNILHRKNANPSSRNSSELELASKEFDIIHSDEISSSSQTAVRRSRGSDLYSSMGIIRLQEKLYLLLKDYLLILPDNHADEVLQHYVKLEILLVLANHHSPQIRAAILSVVSVICNRLDRTELEKHSKKFSWFHLGNQISTHLVDNGLFEVAIQSVSGYYYKLGVIAELEQISIQNPYCINALIGLLPQTTTNPELASKAFKIMLALYSDVQNTGILIENGIIQSSAKTLYNIFSKNVITFTFEIEIRKLLMAIGERSLKFGNIQNLWTILNILTYYESKKSENVIKGFRSVQANLLQYFLSMLSMSQSNFTDSQFSVTEIRTRFDLIYDHSSQFFISANPLIKCMDSEIHLFKLMGNITDLTKCNNFLIWGLLPTAPPEIHDYIIKLLVVKSKQGHLNHLSIDGNIIKSFLWNRLVDMTDKNIRNQNLIEICGKFNVKLEDNSWASGLETDAFQINRENCIIKQKSTIDKAVYIMENVAQECIESSMSLTRKVTESMHTESKTIMNHLKQYNQCYSYQEWNNIIKRMTHKGAPWYNSQEYPRSWELSPIEGPSRIHTRLQRTNLELNKRYFIEERCPPVSGIKRSLDYLVSNHERQFNISVTSQIQPPFPAKMIPIDGEIDGELIITDHKIYFLPSKYCGKLMQVSCDISDISEIWLKRYQHQEKAIEILLDSNRLLFFAFNNENDFKTFRDMFEDKIAQTPDSNKIQAVTQQWRDGNLTNWEYLMALNQFSGRTYNDLMQYPVFPWILSNYTSKVLDLYDCDNFRKLHKPIAIQNETNESHYVDNYNYIASTATNMGTLSLQPYHFSSHYSNSGTVLHFLVRVPPYTGFFLKYQDNNFDIPDRTFHSLNTTWNLASRDSPTDVKELIPEFFTLPELFVNSEGFNFGIRQTGDRVHNVELPPWCYGDPRLFVLIHRQALESEQVRNTIHNWIDLIFGYKQTGQSAIDAINVFHPSTYSEFLSSKVLDPIEQKAVETMIKTYGQMPKQLFKTPHPSSKPLSSCDLESVDEHNLPVLSSVRGLRWGAYTGSPQLNKPILKSSHKFADAACIVPFPNTNDIYALSEKCHIMQASEADIYNILSWNNNDGIVRFQSALSMQSEKVKTGNLLYDNLFDEISCCGTSLNSNTIWFGHKSGIITVYKCYADETHKISKSRHSFNIRLSYNSAIRKITSSTKSGLNMGTSMSSVDTNCDENFCIINSLDSDSLKWAGPVILTGHENEVTCITLSDEFKIAVSADANGVAKIWNLNDMTYIRNLTKTSELTPFPIKYIAISSTLGDIVTVHVRPNADRAETISDSASDSVINSTSDEAFEVTEENLEGFINVAVNPNGNSIMRLHSINAKYVNKKVLENNITAVCYSYIKEGVGVNVIATGFDNGIISFWSSWNLDLIREISIGIYGVKSLAFSTYHHLCVLTDDNYLQVWESDGLNGKAPKSHPIHFS